MKDKPLIPAQPEIRKKNEDIFYESTERQAEPANHRDRLAKQPALEETDSKFLVIADDEFFDADNNTSWERGSESELLSSDEVEGSSMDEEQPDTLNHVRPLLTNFRNFIHKTIIYSSWYYRFLPFYFVYFGVSPTI